MERRYKIIEFRNYDGDSFDLTLDLGFNLVIHRPCRLEGADTPELRDRRPDFKAAGYLAKRRAHEWITAAMEAGGAYFLSETYTGKYGRPLGNIVDSHGAGLRAMLLTEHLAVPYHGQAKSQVEEGHLRNLAELRQRGAI